MRKNLIARAFLVLRILFSAVVLVLALLVVHEFFDVHIATKTAVTELQNGIQTAAVTVEPATKARKSQDYQILVRKPLLGDLTKPEAPAAKPPPKPSTLALSLIGTVLTDTQAPYAIIEDTKKAVQDVFNTGEMIFGEAKLLKIHVDKVEIERNGQVEILVLDDSPGSGSGSRTGPSDENTFVVDEGELDKALQNLPLLLTQARAVPYFKDGVSVGLRLFAIKSDSIFEKIGLKNGDILKSINGNSLADLTQAMKLFETLKEQRSIVIKLERNLEEKEFKYEIR